MRASSVLTALLLLADGTSFAADASKPNIVFILADDFGHGDLGCYGHPYARTPNIDRLASEGTRFCQFYSTGVTCCPARTGLMTSKFPATFATYPANGGFGERITITELLKKAGYRTGHFGKWHIGPNTQPGTYGIDSIVEEKGDRGEQTRGRDAPIHDDAITFIEKNKEGPFYVNVWGHISHHPVNPPQSYIDKFKEVIVKESDFAESMREKFDIVKRSGEDISKHMRRYLADVYSMDEDIGRLLKRIDELGLRENTIVVFSSDQGAAPIRVASLDGKAKKKKGKNDTPDLRLNALGSAGELRGGKHGMYEGGVRVPFIIRWPGHVPARRVDEQSVISGIDWLPTLCSLAGLELPTTDIDGDDASAAWMGDTFSRTKPLLWKTSNPQSDIAIRDGQWKLHSPNRRRGEVELYDVVADPGERHNLAVAQANVVQTLTAKLEKWNSGLPKSYNKTDDRQD